MSKKKVKVDPMNPVIWTPTSLTQLTTMSAPPTVAKAGEVYKAPCHIKHTTLKLGGGEVRGASCIYPLPGFDIYVGFDVNMELGKHYPWGEHAALDIYFPVKDRHAPKDAKEFKRLIAWLATQLAAGKSIHMGCIGGHGRTGLALAALYAQVCVGLPEAKQAAAWVRANHCERAIESAEQVEFLAEHYGIEPVSMHAVKAVPDDLKPLSNYQPVGGRSLWSDAVRDETVLDSACT